MNRDENSGHRILSIQGNDRFRSLQMSHSPILTAGSDYQDPELGHLQTTNIVFNHGSVCGASPEGHAGFVRCPKVHAANPMQFASEYLGLYDNSSFADIFRRPQAEKIMCVTRMRGTQPWSSEYSKRRISTSKWGSKVFVSRDSGTGCTRSMSSRRRTRDRTTYKRAMSRIPSTDTTSFSMVLLCTL